MTKQMVRLNVTLRFAATPQQVEALSDPEQYFTLDYDGGDFFICIGGECSIFAIEGSSLESVESVTANLGFELGLALLHAEDRDNIRLDNDLIVEGMWWFADNWMSEDECEAFVAVCG